MVLDVESFFADASNTYKTWRDLQSLLEKEGKLAEYRSMENAFDPEATHVQKVEEKLHTSM